VIKLRILKWGDYGDLSGWAQFKPGIFKKGREAIREARRCDERSRVWSDLRNTDGL
jgi:hypothetical protein